MAKTDHDILIEVGVKLDRAITDIKEMDRHFSTANSGKLDRLTFDNWSREFNKDMERELEGIKKSINETLGELRKNHEETKKDHEDRIRRLERWGFVAIGGLAVLQIIIGIVK